ncbi:CubicO group peptidase (beta-lactamase class C family) [Povalibacter uvarum]|uniref:CubicO group peptidase (Beta-lactamase class C family) n=1 Tax=Povalibacter uvarum TaxID=732238 RepID=A0A841HKY0_9GAMM|nr:serine hydrolase domain-containing protein [Povalibacter uvarum]MBB6093717.1 CubicO group peptidase (beta-lactamase class C family) [Povalibacter uvarum]
MNHAAMHLRSGRSLIASALLLSICALSHADSAKTGAWPVRADAVGTEAGFSAAGLEALDARMKAAVEKKDIAGAVTLLSHKGKVAAFNTYGTQSLDAGSAPMSDDTIFRIYSMTKPITGVAIMQLYEKGLWKLDDPVTKYVPELAGLKVVKGKDAEGKPILVDLARPATMKELMTHTAGFGYGLQPGNPADDGFIAKQPLGKPDLKALVDTVAEIPLLAQPGERWSYSIAVDIQGLIVERLSGEKFGDYLRNHIFQPLSMSETTFALDAKAEPRVATVYRWDAPTSALVPTGDKWGPRVMPLDSGGGGLYSTMHDYARFCQMLLNQGTLDGKQVLKSETVALMTQNHIGELKLFGGLPGTGFGLDFAVITDPAALKSAQGEGSYWWFGIAGTWFWVDPKNDLFFVGLIQRRLDGGTTALRNESVKLVYEALQK